MFVPTNPPYPSFPPGAASNLTPGCWLLTLILVGFNFNLGLHCASLAHCPVVLWRVEECESMFESFRPGVGSVLSPLRDRQTPCGHLLSCIVLPCIVLTLPLPPHMYVVCAVRYVAMLCTSATLFLVYPSRSRSAGLTLFGLCPNTGFTWPQVNKTKRVRECVYGRQSIMICVRAVPGARCLFDESSQQHPWHSMGRGGHHPVLAFWSVDMVYAVPGMGESEI
jgi:hypothetical protein